MTKFKDSEGHEWLVKVTNRTVRRIKEECSIDVRELLNDSCKPLFELMADSVQLVGVLFVACEAQAKEADISIEDFEDRVYGDVSERAAEAFAQALIDFFPNPQLRAAMRDLLGKATEVKDEILKGAKSSLDQALSSVDAKSIATSALSELSAGLKPTT